MARVLVVDDSQETCDLLELLLGQGNEGMNLEVLKATRPEEALRQLEGGGIDLMLSDINLEATLDGMDLLRAAKPLGVEVILLTGFGTIERALEAVREGAFDFLSKPWNNEELKTLVKRALMRRTGREGAARNGSPRAQRSVMIGSSPKMMEVYKTIASLQNSKTTVLLSGESGTGKELVARTIHASSDRKDMPFVALNCGALTETLLESELFGHVKGAFTGAIVDKKGLFEEASGGTIFLDEVGETSPSFQVKLLRVLQEQEIRRVGGSRTIKVDARVIAASNRDLAQMVKSGGFREDLYYRLSVVEIRVPPVRERWSQDGNTGRIISDVPLLLDHFMEEARARNGQPYAIRADARACLEAYSWPGNVREMANVVEHITQLSRGREITPEDLPEKVRAEFKARRVQLPGAPQALLELVEGWERLPTLEELEHRYIQVLLRHEPRKSRVAEILGKDRTTLYRKLKDLGLGDAPDESL